MSEIPPDRQCTMPRCEREKITPGEQGGLCPEHAVDDASIATCDEDVAPQTNADDDSDAPSNGWGAADFTETESGVWPATYKQTDAWMLRKDGKKPWAPWADPDAPVVCSHGDHDDETTCAECDHSARYKWGSEGSAEHVHTDYQTALEWREKHPQARSGLVFIQHDNDGYGFVDGDDVRCPESGDVHPAFVAILKHLGVTYADVSISDSGVHAPYLADELPIDGKDQATFDIDDEPWGENDDPPTVEIYANKHVCVATGEHVVGTPTELREWNSDALRAILQANGYEDDPAPSHDTDGERDDLEAHDPDATDRDETTDDIRDILKAVDRLTPSDVDLGTTQTGEDSTGWTTWDPSYRTSESGASLHYNGDGVFYDHKEGEEFGVLGLLAAEESIITDPWSDLSGSDWWEAVEAARDDGASIPEYAGSSEDGEPVAGLPLNRLARLDRDDAKRYARKHGRDWPSTREARDRLEGEVHDAMRSGSTTVIDAPTALGKSYTVSTTPWLNRQDIAGGAPVVMFHETREVRDSAANDSNEANVSHCVLKGRSEACPVAAGKHDPVEGEDEDDPDLVLTVNGVAASEWFDAMCDGRGVPFSVAHAHLREHNDQGADLPCREEGECHAIAQWEGVPRDDEGETSLDIIHATHQFAHVPSLQRHTNMVFDERPDFAADLPHDRIRRAITAYMKEAGAPVGTYEELVTRARKDEDDVSPNEHAEHPYVSQALDHEPDREWYLKADGAHTLAPALTRAVWYAIRDGADANGRFAATVTHEPPRLDAEAVDEDGWNREYVSVVVDEDNTVRRVRTTPDLSLARSVVGLDAHPAMTLWQQNVHPDIQIQPVMDVEERQLWRLFERGLLVAQVGDAVRPYASGEYFDADRSRAFLEALREGFGGDFRTAITASAVEHRYEQLMEEAGVDDPQTMHYGEEKSRDDFADENVGAVDGSIDPGDDYVLDTLAEAGLEATPETSESGSGEEYRARGRGFEGRDAELASHILASVREQHVAQAAGRYARNADDPKDTAIVFVRTSAMPAGFADVQVPGVEWVATDTQREIIDALRERESATARELSEDTGASKQWVAETLARLRESDVVDCREGAGKWGADLFATLANVSTEAAGVDLESGAEWITNDGVWGSYTWSLAIHPGDNTTIGVDEQADGGDSRRAMVNGGDNPPPG